MGKDYRKEFAERRKAIRFTKEFYKEHGVFPAVSVIEHAKVLTPAEEAALELDAEVAELVDETGEIGVWEYIWNEASWNESYANGALKDYYIWADGLSPYKEDLWNTVELRPANWNDIEKDEHGNPIEYEDGYHYINCVRCWLGAVNAPGAKYPWCAVDFTPFSGKIKLEYKGDVVWPWGEADREFKRTFAIASIPEELGDEYLLVDGKTTFEPEHLNVSIFKK